MASSLIGAWLRATSPSHFTRVRTIRIGLPQHAQFTAGRELGCGILGHNIIEAHHTTRFQSTLIRFIKVLMYSSANSGS